MGKAKKTRSTSHKKQVPPTGGLSQFELEADNDLDYSTMQADEAEMFRGVRVLAHHLYGSFVYVAGSRIADDCWCLYVCVHF